jgi:hypothetical protein
VYWTDSNGAVMSVPIAGGAARTVASAQTNPQFVAVDATRVYWVNVGTGLSDGQVLSAPKGGGRAVTLAGTLNSPGGFAIDATNAYWTSQGSAADCYAGGTVMKVAFVAEFPR